ncbi:MAG: Ig-like domain-containing protein, partial [Bacteroidota bacterium]
GTGTATSGSDYTAISASAQISVADGMNMGTISIPVTDDALLEADTETLIIQISNSSKSSVTITTATATGTITDDDTATAALSVTTQGNETGSVAIVYTVTLSEVNHTGSVITFDFEDLGTGTATSGSDYATISGSAQVSVADGTNVGTISIPVIDDALLEADTETLTTQISTPSNGDVTITTATATGTITDDETATAALSVTTQGNEDGPVALVYTVTLSEVNHTSGVITFDFEDLGTGTATSGSDYTAIPGSAQVSVADGTNVGTISITVTDDALLEADTETLTAQISNPSNSDVSITTDIATGTVTYNDTAEVLINDATTTEGGAISFSVTLDNDVEGDVVVDISFGGGTASSADYTTTTQTLIFIGGAAGSQTVIVSTQDDFQIENPETFTASMAPGAGNINNNVVVTDTGLGMIHDNDIPGWVIVKIQDGTEGDNDVIYTVRLEDGSGNDLINSTGTPLTISTDFTGLTEAEQTDFSSIYPTSISILEGESSATIALAVFDDNLIEGDELIRATISSPSTGSILTASADATVIDDDDIVTIKIFTTQNGDEDGTNVQYRIQLTDSVGTALTNATGSDISASVSFSGSAVQADIATALPDNVVISDGLSSIFIDLVVNDDPLIEGDETLTAMLNLGVGGTVDTTPANVTVIDNDTAPDVMISNSNESVNEDEILTFSVTNSNAITIDDLDDDLQTVSINVTNGVLLLQDTSGLNITDKEIELIVVTGVTLTEINAALEGAAFNPNAEFNGSASIEITSEDPKGGTDTEIIHITVDYVNDVPIVAGEALSTNEDTLVSGTLSDTVIDIEGDSLIFAVVAGTEPDPATEGTLIMNPDGTYTFIPAENFYGIITFNYKVCDDGTPQMCAQEVVTITVNAINDAPIATPEIITTNEDQQIGGDLSDNVIDIEGDDLSFTVVEATAPDPATQGTLVMNLGTFIFTPVMGFTGDVMFTYEVCDNGAPIECVQEIVTIAIIPNDRPMIMDTSVTVDSIDGISSTLADFVTDSNLDSLAFTLVDDVSNGTLTFTSEGTFDYVPEPGFEGNATFTFEVCDDGIPVKCEQAIFTITVLPMDTDEDGVTDAEEVGSNLDPANNDSDGDGIPDYLDVDDDGDGILTKDENYDGDDDPTDDDTDRDGIPDYLDTDDDGDGIDTPDEDANEDGDLTNDDCDNEGIPDYLDSDECGDFETTLVITANGDGINDGLVIEGIENFPNNSVTIYNRWGNVVWEIKGYRNDELQKNFTGASNTGFLSNNGGLPDGTYYYVINKEDGSPVQKGFLVIKK